MSFDEKGERIAKVLARAGVCSRRDAERLIEAGRVSVNGRVLDTPALNVRGADDIRVDGRRIGAAEATRLWRYHKPPGLVTTHRDPQGRATVFDALDPGLPRVVSVGRLDLNSEGLLLLTNDGALARKLELPSSGWPRTYRARAFGAITQSELDHLAGGIEIEGMRYGPIDAKMDRKQGANTWITMTLKEGKNREVRRVLEALGLRVNRLIRTSYGPFQLGTLKPGEIEEIPRKAILQVMSGPNKG